MVSGPMKVLLGGLAVAGYRNRDRIGELLRNLFDPQAGGLPKRPPGEQHSQRSLGDSLKQFQQNRHAETPDSWSNRAPTAEIEAGQLAEALGPDLLENLSAKTGLTQEEILRRLSGDLPRAVDDPIPDGGTAGDDDLSSAAGRPV